MRKILTALLCACLLCGCAVPSGQNEKIYTATFLDLFDTVTTIKGVAESGEAFEQTAAALKSEFEYYHKLFDIYGYYEGVTNLRAVNERAGTEPVRVDSAILELLRDCIRFYDETGGAFNPAMGSVLSLWHEAREDSLNDPENAYLPDSNALEKAALHINPHDIVLDFENSTVFFADSALRLDVGAVAKGWSVQKVCENAPEGLLLSVGGNVFATGPKAKNGTPWGVGIRSPESANKYLNIVNLTYGAVVTSGSYIRAYAVDGKLYHHIIDPQTLYPSALWTSVTIICDDSGLADVLSTSLFLLDRESGQALLDKFNAHALWVDAQGNKYYSPHFEDLIKK